MTISTWIIIERLKVKSNDFRYLHNPLLFREFSIQTTNNVSNVYLMRFLNLWFDLKQPMFRYASCNIIFFMQNVSLCVVQKGMWKIKKIRNKLVLRLIFSKPIIAGAVWFGINVTRAMIDDFVCHLGISIAFQDWLRQCIQKYPKRLTISIDCESI